ncbi:MAG: 16S rRNA (adenine(1518)-N(6)/adenine(1519)-N(6))-dimethyltransferase RsmA [Candidatus Hodarchaeota archaeon]
MNLKEIRLILKELDLKPKKYLGQNFLVDNNTLNKVISESHIIKDDTILEIGPGLGALTEKLIEKAKKVYAIEIDPILYKYISDKFSNYRNIEIINGDILKVDIPFHNKIVSNIPYKITGPIFERVFYKEKPPQGILIIEKSIADRIFSKGNYEKYSRITVSFNTFMKPISKFTIPRNSFYPIPKIELALINTVPKAQINQFLLEDDGRKFYLKFLAGIMPYKNKNIVNAIELFLRQIGISKLEKKEIFQILNDKKFNDYKLFSFKIEDLIEISKLIFNLYNFKKKE